jgi:hypothetical protein
MALTGVLVGIERGLLDTDEVVVHGSGSYAVQDFTPVADGRLCAVSGTEQLRQVLFDAASAGASR